jgi:hypothetical protein
MLDQLEQNVTRVGGKTVRVGVHMAERPGVAVATTAATVTMNFEKVKHILSARPCRRPNRSRPISEPNSLEELTRRIEAQRAAALAKAEANGMKLIGRPRL